MKIGYIIQQSPDLRNGPIDGPSGHILEVIGGLVRRGHKVTLLAYFEGSVFRADDESELTSIEVPLIDRGLLRLIERVIRRIQSILHLPYLNLFESLRFALACRQELTDVDLLYERQSWMGYGGALASMMLDMPLLIEYNGDQLLDLEAKQIAPKGFQKWFALKLTGQCLHHCTFVIASGEGWRRHFIHGWSYPATRIRVVENGSSILRLLPREDLKSFRSDDGPGRPIQLVYLGGFLPWHGVERILKALANVLSSGSEESLILIGDGEGRLEAEHLCIQLDIQKRVSFTGALTPAEFAPILADADIGLSAYCGWKEYSGLKLIDYKAAGLAIIATGENGQPVAIEDGFSGLIIEPCDQASLVSAIQKLSGDRVLRRKMGVAARMDAEAQHGWDHTVQQIEAIMFEVLATPGPQR